MNIGINDPIGADDEQVSNTSDTAVLERTESSAEPAEGDMDFSETSLRVLIVEDSSIVRGRIVRMIAGVKNAKVVGMAIDGTHALALFRELQPDIMLLDIQLPGLDGIELLARVRAENTTCKVIVLTTYAFDEFRRKCLDLRAEYFFDKALEFPRVMELLGRLAQKKTARNPGRIHESAAERKEA